MASLLPLNLFLMSLFEIFLISIALTAPDHIEKNLMSGMEITALAFDVINFNKLSLPFFALI